MDGIVVIGEGEKDNAPMLFNGERGRRRHRPRVRRRGRPDRRHHADRQGHDQRHLGAGGVAARLDVRPVGRVLHGEAGHRPGGRRRRRHPLPGRREHPPGRQGQGHRTPRTSPSCCSTGRGTQELVEEIRATGARIKFITDGDVAGAIMAARARHRHRPAARHRRHPRGHHRRLRDEVHSAASSRAGCGRTDDEERQRALDAGHDLDRDPARPTTWSPATTASSSPPASPTAS